MPPDLKTYLAAPGRKFELAAKLNVSTSYLYQMATGRRPVPLALVHVIEKETGVRLWSLRHKDWFRIWPHLIDEKGAPSVPGSKRKRAAAAVAKELSEA